MDRILNKSHRKAGYLPPTTGDALPRHIIFFDTETNNAPDNPESKEIYFRLKVGYVVYIEIDDECNVKRRDEKVFYDGYELAEFIERHTAKNRKLYCFAHNTPFDCMSTDLIPIFKELGYVTKPPIYKERMFIWDVKIGEGNIVFLDTAQYGVGTLERLGKDMKLAKLKIDFKTADLDKLIIYCQRDVEIIEKFMLEYIRFIHTNDLGEFKHTIASQSLNAFRKRFMKTGIRLHNIPDILELERKAYFGGRTECFHIGQLNRELYYALDVNSMYPFVMQNKYMPVRYKFAFKKVDLEFLAIWISKPRENYYIIADVLLDTEVNAFPFVHNHRLVFPVGQFRTVLHHAELVKALQSNSIKKVYHMVVYDAGLPFKDYVEFFYQLKVKYTLEDNSSWRFIVKLFLNSLYGKFGQIFTYREYFDGEYEEIIERCTGYSHITGQDFEEVNWWGTKYREYHEGESRYSFPALSGAVTAEARMYLYELMELAGHGNYFYVDTDSLLVNHKGFVNLIDVLDDNRLGALKIQHQVIDVKIYGNKDYEMEFIAKTKGVQQNAKIIKEGVWEVIQFETFKAYLNRGAIGGAKGHVRTKRRIGVYRKGIVLEDGHVEPLRLNMIE